MKSLTIEKYTILFLLLTAMAFGETACHNPKRRTNYRYGFCGEQIKAPMTEAVGKVVSKWDSPDGDHIVNLEPEEGFRRLLYEVKWNYQKGDPKYYPFQGCCVHLEIEPCEWKKLKDFWEKIQVGDRIWVKGGWTKDPHGKDWMEIHPVMEGRIIPKESTETFPPFDLPGLKPILPEK